MIPFNEWLPDIARFGSKGCVDVLNVKPTVDGFEPFGNFVTATAFLPATCAGAFGCISSESLEYNFAGTDSHLYQYIPFSEAWVTASTSLPLIQKVSWNFAKWGEKVIAVGGVNANTTKNPPQIINLSYTANFQDLSGDPPQARHIAVVRDFVVLGSVYEDGEFRANRVRWSGINDETNWTTDIVAQAGYYDIQGDVGPIQAICGGERGIIIHENAISRMEYIGAPVVFSFTKLSTNLGTPAPNSVVQVGNNVYFYSQDGFIALENDEIIHRIGRHKIDEWFKGVYDSSNNKYLRMIGAHESASNKIYWIYCQTASPIPSTGVVYDTQSGRWSKFGQSHPKMDWIYEFYKEGNIGNISVFDSSRHSSGFWNGTAKNCFITTKEVYINPNYRTLVNRVRAEVIGATVAVNIAIGYRNSLEESVTWGSDIVPDRDGAFPVRVNARYHSFKVSISGNFKKALGVSIIESHKAGKT